MKENKVKISLIVIILIILLVIVSVIGVFKYTKNTLPKENLEQKANEIFGSVYCVGNHEIMAGDALTPWTCELCGYSDINPDTDVPVICGTCTNLTGRCRKCGKLDK